MVSLDLRCPLGGRGNDGLYFFLGGVVSHDKAIRCDIGEALLAIGK